MEKETNLFDLCKSFCRAVGRGCGRFVALLGRMLQLTFRFWWIVLPVVLLFAIAACYYARRSNRLYQVNAVAVLNGPSTEAAADYWTALDHSIPGYDVQNRAQLLQLNPEIAKRISRFETFYVIDSKHDGTADMVDYRHKTHAEDTLNVRMTNMLALRFYTKDIEALPEIEEHLMAYMNGNEQFQKAYQTALISVERRHQYDVEQMEKLDSLTSAFYFEQGGAHPTQSVSTNPWASALVVGDRRIELFLKDINLFFRQRLANEQTYTYREAPVVLVNHFVANAKPVNGRIKCLAIGLLIGWVMGCLIAAFVQNRKKVIAFLKQ